MNKNFYRFELTEGISTQGNLLIFSVFLKELYKKNIKLEITIPKKITDSLNKSTFEFNTFFTDILLDAGFIEENLNITVSNINHFFVKIG